MIGTAIRRGRPQSGQRDAVRQQLRDLPVGGEVTIRYRRGKMQSVRATCWQVAEELGFRIKTRSEIRGELIVKRVEQENEDEDRGVDRESA